MVCDEDEAITCVAFDGNLLNVGEAHAVSQENKQISSKIVTWETPDWQQKTRAFRFG